MKDQFKKIQKAILDRQNQEKNNIHDYLYIGMLSDGLKPFQNKIVDSKGGLFGYLNTKNEVVIDAKYLDAKPFSNGIAAVAKMVVNEKIVEDLNSKGASNVFSKLMTILGETSSLETEKRQISKEIKYGYIDTEGSKVIDFMYDEAYSFSEKHAVVRKGDEWLLIDAENNKKVEIEVDNVLFPFMLQKGKLQVLKNGAKKEIDLSIFLK